MKEGSGVRNICFKEKACGSCMKETKLDQKETGWERETLSKVKISDGGVNKKPPLYLSPNPPIIGTL